MVARIVRVVAQVVRAGKQSAGKSEQPFTRWPLCGGVVETPDPGVAYAVELVRAQTFGGTDMLEGMGGYFYPGCSPEALVWRSKPAPS